MSLMALASACENRPSTCDITYAELSDLAPPIPIRSRGKFWLFRWAMAGFDAIVPTRRPRLPQPQFAQRQIHIVVDHQHGFGRQLVPVGDRPDRLAGNIHEGGGLEQPQLLAFYRRAFAKLTLKLTVLGERDLPAGATGCRWPQSQYCGEFCHILRPDCPSPQ